MAKKNKGGRPTVFTKETLDKLRHAFLMGCSDAEACIYANIHPTTLYTYQLKTEGFKEQKELWKNNPTLVARSNVHNALQEGDKDMTKWYLERKKKDEFSTRSEITGKDGGGLFGILDEIDGRSKGLPKDQE